eukprot:2043458-Amphidinium_carterae.3
MITQAKAVLYLVTGHGIQLGNTGEENQEEGQCSQCQEVHSGSTDRQNQDGQCSQCPQAHCGSMDTQNQDGQRSQCQGRVVLEYHATMTAPVIADWISCNPISVAWT